jgi:glutaredoxin
MNTTCYGPSTRRPRRLFLISEKNLVAKENMHTQRLFAGALILWGLGGIAAGIAVGTGRVSICAADGDKPRAPLLRHRLVGAGLVLAGLASLLHGLGVFKGGRTVGGSVGCGKISVYSMKGCPHCETARKKLNAKGVRYTENEWVKGQGDPPMMPNGERASSFPTVFVNGKKTEDGSAMKFLDTCQ